MKASKLIELLQGVDPDAEVILQKDSEGNGYSPLEGVETDYIYIPNNTWDGEVYHSKATAGDTGLDPKAWTKLKKRPCCVLLYPVN